MRGPHIKGCVLSCRWTMVLTPKFVPWRPRVTLTGCSHYTVAAISGQITSHTDTWDGLSDNSYLSVGRSPERVITM